MAGASRTYSEHRSNPSFLNMLLPQDFKIRDKALRVLGFTSYGQYLESEHWRCLKASRRRQKCFTCQTKKKRMDIHHMTYERLGEEQEDDICSLCDDCHFSVHHTYMIFSRQKPWSKTLLREATMKWKAECTPVGKPVEPMAPGYYPPKKASHAIQVNVERTWVGTKKKGNWVLPVREVPRDRFLRG